MTVSQYIKIPKGVNVPKNILDSKFIKPPLEVIQLVESISPESHIFFHEHPIVQKSYRNYLDIFVNARLTYWRNYTNEPLWAKSYGEVLILRVLHELGHIVCGHKGSLKIENGKVIQIVSDTEVERCEKEAWDWAIRYRSENLENYINLVYKCQLFAETHPYTEVVDWQ
ncbi:hypothetical protein [Anaeromicrobium sediminis]|uniref:IrrE N-terminal-like domain-containing protein n=1 Tax=Anaeromicrobium sediminis TaxID=1478221 RepID=A0A267MN23_9FIRM|nr:hypothetical protein [Anaeromicrobium sediminis]PAB61001.1 hypothetical protein CCE28_00795 [Anaeromicrobium sediminis]